MQSVKKQISYAASIAKLEWEDLKPGIYKKRILEIGFKKLGVNNTFNN